MGIQILLLVLLAQRAPSPGLDQRQLCALAERLLVHAQPGEHEIGCVVPFALTECGRNGLFSAGRPVMRMMLQKGDDSVDLLAHEGACSQGSVKIYRVADGMPPGASSYIQVWLRTVGHNQVRFSISKGRPSAYPGGPAGGAGCGNFYGSAKLVDGAWQLTPTRRDGRRIRAHRGQRCEYTTDQVLRGPPVRPEIPRPRGPG